MIQRLMYIFRAWLWNTFAPKEEEEVTYPEPVVITEDTPDDMNEKIQSAMDKFRAKVVEAEDQQALNEFNEECREHTAYKRRKVMEHKNYIDINDIIMARGLSSPNFSVYYRLLEIGERIKITDEYQLSTGAWKVITEEMIENSKYSFGSTVIKNDISQPPIRRREEY